MIIKKIQVKKNHSGLRVDKWFHKIIPSMPFTKVAKLVRKGQIRLDGRRIKISDRVASNQVIRTPVISYSDMIKKIYTKTDKFNLYKNNLLQSTIYEDEYILVLNKRYNLCVQDGSNVTISIDRILKLLNLKFHIVHRIDKETTGLLVLAKNSLVAGEMSRLFRENKVNKNYLAIWSRIPNNKQGLIKLDIIKKSPECNRILSAETKYEVISRYKNLLSLVKLYPVTGRKHQIRIHSKQLGYTILGDQKYSDYRMKDNIYSTKYLHLHSHSLKFKLFDNIYILKANLTGHFMQTIEKYFSSQNIESLL